MSEDRSYRAEGIVLRNYKLGETDRIVVLYTAEHGKVRAVAKGARKPRSRFAGRTEPTSHVQVQLYKGRGDLDTVTGIEAAVDLSGIRSDLDKITNAAAMLEAVSHITPDREPNQALFRMLAGALEVVATDNPALVTAGFFWKMLALEGFHPQLNTCVGCGEVKTEHSDDLVAFDFDDGGVRCSSCRRGRPVSADALDMVRMILGGHLSAALQLPPSPAATETNALASAAVEHYVERDLRSIKVLER